jgi:hypothetical protein
MEKSFKPKIVSEVIQPNEGGHDMLKMMLGTKKKMLMKTFRNSNLEACPNACVVGTWR